MAASLGRLRSAIYDQEERKTQYQSHIRGLNAYDRHKKFINDYGYTCSVCNRVQSFINNFLT